MYGYPEPVEPLGGWLRIINAHVPYYDDYGFDTETELVFTRKTATFYEVFLWAGRYLQARARAIKVLEEKEIEWLRTAPGDSPFSSQGVYLRMLQPPRT